MWALRPEMAIYWLALVQALGLFSAALARLGEGSRRQTSCQRLFFLCLTLVGVGTLAAMMLGPGPCVTSGATLAVMVLAATWDGGARHYSH